MLFRSKNFYKVNTNGGTNKARQCPGIRVVIRDYRGQLMAALSSMIPNLFEVEVVEALALRREIILADEIGIRRIILESDAEKVVRAFKSDHEDLSDLSLIIDDCKAFAINFLSFDCCFVRRSSNQCAHVFAKHGTLIDSEEVWIEDGPDWVTP